ncbi:hypothetical protein B566_EDAN014455 [Ephemera danica]|nr:hypothetical protein B566_EDAN014455 [Ephemera danica]
MSVSKPLRALTLVSYVNKKLILNEDVLKEILESEEARYRPVAVISIAGCFRKGKSFFLNFILRYLNSMDDPNWMGSQIGPLVGFDWRPDEEGVTSGITIWPEVFVVKNTAIVLIDTQGLYETSKNTIEDTYIMTLSFLFSSIQILNHQENLNSSDLKNFEFFAKYGMALESKTTNIKGFQNLIFLIRDWKHVKNRAFGFEGGNKYLKYFLQTNINEELDSVRETLNHFENVDCFLMPYPGETVARSDEFKGDIEQIDPKFLDNMKDLVQSMIANVKPKVLLGKKANGECVFQLMKNYVKCLNDGKLPAPKSLIQLQMDILQNKAEKDCLSIYNNAMSNGTKDKLLDNAEMDILHKKWIEAALKIFDDLPVFGNQDEIKTAKSNCSQMIEKCKYKSAMEEKVKSRMNALKIEAERESLTIFNEGMTKETEGKLVDKSQMKKLHKKFAAAALEVFDKIPIIFGYKELIESGKLQCSKMIEASDYKLRMEEHVKQHVLTIKNNVEKECMMIYNDGMTNRTSVKILNNSEMDILHKECATEALKKFEKLPDLGNQEEFENAKLQCIKMMEANVYKERMEEKVKSHLNTLQNNAEKECMMIYNNGMTKATKEKFLKKSEMVNLHNEFATEALKVFDNLQSDVNRDQIKNAKLQCAKMIEASDYKSRMEEKVKNYMVTLITNSEMDCIMIYNDGMSKGTSGKLLISEEIEKLHQECSTGALKEFDKLPDLGYQKEIKAAKFQCLKTIEASDYKKKMKKKLKSHLNNLQNNAEKECMMIYNNGMTKATKGKFLQNSEMDNLHKEFAAEALKVFDNLQHYGNQDQLKNAKLQCTKMIETSDYKSRMEEKVKSHMITLQSNAEKECMMIYTNGMINGTKEKLLNIAEMEQLHNDCKSTALGEFDYLPDFGNQNQIKNARSQCSKMIEASDFKSRMEEKVKMQETTGINQVKEKCMEIYNDNMRKQVANKFLSNSKMEEIHTYFAAAALKEFDNLSDFGCQEEVRTAKSKCAQMIEASDYKSRMEEKVKSDMNTQQNNAQKECMNIYNDEMKRGTEGKLLNNAEMDNLHKECVAEALKVFDLFPDFGNQDEIKIAIAQCSKLMNATEFKLRMEEKRKMQISTKLNQAKEECMELYNEKMRRFIRNKSLTNAEMEKVHMECAASALKVFDHLTDFVTQEEIRIAKSKCSQTIDASDWLTRMDEKVKMESSTQLSQATEECMKIYHLHMRKNTRDQLLKTSEFNGLHNESEAAALEVFEDQ